METITLGDGCFWCTEAIFKRLNGVIQVTSGYAGESDVKPTYEKLVAGQSGFTEVIQIEFDPKKISLEKILEVFFATHDPTTLNRQGADVGSQYRSVIFYRDEGQKKVAETAKEKAQHDYHNPIVTKIEPFKNFYTAEEYHQNFYENNKNTNPYCSLVIEPKIQKLISQFNSDLKV